MKTAEPVRQLALYVSTCPKCQKFCSWEIEEEVVSWQEMDNLELEAA